MALEPLGGVPHGMGTVMFERMARRHDDHAFT